MDNKKTLQGGRNTEEMPLREHASTYFIQDQGNVEEMTRLEIQAKMLTTGMGGVLPELVDHSHLQRVLDVGCGTGNWLMQTARTYPTIGKLVGADINSKMLAYTGPQRDAAARFRRNMDTAHRMGNQIEVRTTHTHARSHIRSHS